MNNELLKLMGEIRDPEMGIINFCEKVLGLPVSHHAGQVKWLKNSKRRINILRPGNKYGKSLIGAAKHIYHHFTKINMQGMYTTWEEWEKLKYDTLNFGPGYEQAREIPRMVRDIVQGNVFIPLLFQKQYGVTNRSMLKDWFITHDKADAQVLPSLSFWGGGNLLARSYDEMGAAFKMKGVAYASGDEVADIAELWTFTNGTLLPRGVAYKNFSIDYYGTPQPDGFDYMRMIEMAESDMKAKGNMWYVQKGSMFENPFLDEDTVREVERIADPVLRKQIIDGEYVQTGTKYFGFARIANAVDSTLRETERGLPGRRYVVSVDFAGGESAWADYTVLMAIDTTEDPYKLVYFNRFKGGSIPIPMQYKMVEEVFDRFKTGSLETRLVIDSSALGGKNAGAFLKHLQPITYNISASLKAEMLATLKIALDGGQSENFKRKVRVTPDGRTEDLNPNWGLIKIPNHPYLITELQNYKIDDAKIRTDCVMTLAQAVHYIEMRRPKMVKRKMVNFDLAALS